MGEGTHKVQLVVQNTGWLPTQVTEKALERKAVRPLEVELTLPEGAELVAGERRTEAGQLTGRVHRRSFLWWGGDDATSDLARSTRVWKPPESADHSASRCEPSWKRSIANETSSSTSSRWIPRSAANRRR